MRRKNTTTFDRIESFINDFSDEKGYSPSMTEIVKGTGYPKTTVHRYISQMREDGRIDYSCSRSYTTKKTKVEAIRVPILGAIACGIPRFAEENIEEYVKLPASLFGQGDFFLLHAYGDSMIGAGIEDGDLVLIKQQNYADNGQIVVALVNDEATLKRFYPEPSKHRVRLHPENPEMKDILVKSCEIQGIAVKVLKDLA